MFLRSYIPLKWRIRPECTCGALATTVHCILKKSIANVIATFCSLQLKWNYGCLTQNWWCVFAGAHDPNDLCTPYDSVFLPKDTDPSTGSGLFVKRNSLGAGQFRRLPEQPLRRTQQRTPVEHGVRASFITYSAAGRSKSSWSLNTAALTGRSCFILPLHSCHGRPCANEWMELTPFIEILRHRRSCFQPRLERLIHHLFNVAAIFLPNTKSLFLNLLRPIKNQASRLAAGGYWCWKSLSSPGSRVDFH